MPRQVVLLRGVNLGSRNRIAMPELRDVLESGGLDEVRTYLQSGNVVLSSTLSGDKLADEVQRRIATHFGLDLDVVVRTRSELAKVVQRNPLGDVAENPKRYQVSFLSSKPGPDLARKLAAAAAEPERFAVIGREIYAWHPDGIGRSKLWALLAGKDLGVTATARNWTTVTKLLAMADE